MKPILFAALLAVSTLSPLAATLEITNRSLIVRFDEARQSLSATDRSTGLAFVTEARLQGKAATETSRIRVEHPDGSTTLELRGDAPFLFVTRELRNPGAGDMEIREFSPLSFRVDLGKPASALRVQGTGGLTAPDKNPGSYLFLACADPETRRGVVAGWVTEDRGSGVFFSTNQGDQVEIKAQIDYGRLRIPAGKSATLETLAVGFFPDARLGLEAYADLVKDNYRIHLRPAPAVYCSWYSDQHGLAGDAKSTLELGQFVAKELKPFGLNVIQIDDGWQDRPEYNGPRRGFDHVRPDGPYAGGIAPVAAEMENLGLTFGLWWLPFGRNYQDPEWQDRQHWFVKREDGKPFDTAWGGTCLDLTQPEVRAHLAHTARLYRSWGVKYYKMDGLWTGTASEQIYVNDGYKDDHLGNHQPFHDPLVSNIQAYRSGLKLLRENAGEDVFFSGCCVAQNMRELCAVGLVDSMRIGPDYNADGLGSRTGPMRGSRLYFLNGRVWWNDPDPAIVRGTGGAMGIVPVSLDEARLGASWVAISGQFFLISDWLPGLPPERLEVLKRCLPMHHAQVRPVDYFDTPLPRIWLLTNDRDGSRRDVVALFNWDQKNPATISCPLARLGLIPQGQYVGFDFWANKFVPPFRDKIEAQLPPGSCRILALRYWNNTGPDLISTSRHVTQGAVDLLSAKPVAEFRDEGGYGRVAHELSHSDPWTNSTLSGTSEVVANDPYELRILVPVATNSWAAKELKVSVEDKAAGVTTAVVQDGPRVRATLRSPTNREVRWEVVFDYASVASAPLPALTGLKASTTYGAVTLSWNDINADGYRVTRNDGAKFDCMTTSFLDTTVDFGRKYRYTVQAIAWPGAAPSPAEVEVTTPKKLQRPPTPPTPEIHLADLKPITVQNGWGQLGVNKSIEGNPLIVEGQRYEHGLGMHAEGLAVFAIPQGVKRFVAVAGPDDEKKDDPRSSVTFEVYGDRKEPGETPRLLDRSPVLSSKTIRAWSFNLELDPRFKELRLVVTDADDGNASDHADWVDAGFIRSK